MSKDRWGEGNVYLRGENYWIHYQAGGKTVRESAKTTDAAKARKLLRTRLNQSDRGEAVGGSIQKMTVAELLDDLVKDYERNKKSVAWAKIVRKHLLKSFKYTKATRVGTAQISAYQTLRTEEGVAGGTINRELALLRHAFYLGAKAEPPKVARVPKIEKLPEGPARKGFFDRKTLDQLAAHLKPELAAIARFAFFTCCRKSEILMCQWEWVDLDEEAVALPPEITKNGEGRVIPLVPELVAELREIKADRDKFWPESPWVFSRAGHRIKNFYAAWKTACEAAKLPAATRLLHDMRRSGVRNLVRAGVSEGVAMAISGHKTRSVFDRYNITSKADLKDAVKKLAQFGAKKKAE